MNPIVMFILISVSCTITLVRAEILERPKGWIIDSLPVKLEKLVGSFLYCSQCLGFWVGIAISLILNVWITEIPVLDQVMLGMVSSYLSSIGDRLVYGIPGDDDEV